MFSANNAIKLAARRTLTGFRMARKPFSAAVLNTGMMPGEEQEPSFSKKSPTYEDLPFGQHDINLFKLFTGRLDRNVDLMNAHAKHGDTFKMNTFGQLGVVTRDPDFVRAVVSPHEANLDRPNYLKNLKGINLIGDVLAKVDKRNEDLLLLPLATAEDKKNWGIPRATAVQGFNKMSFVKQSNDTVHMVAEQLVKRWQKQCTAALRKQGAGYSNMPRGYIRCATVEEDLQRFALDILGYLAFDKDFGRLSEEENDSRTLGREIIKNYQIVMKHWMAPKFMISPVKWWNYVGHLSKDFKEFEKALLSLGEIVIKLMEERAEQRRANGGTIENKCYVDMLMESDKASKFTNEWFMMQGIMIIFAGADTTTNTSTFMAYELARNPDWQDRIYDAIAPVFAANPRPSYTDLAEIPELNAFIKETQRMYPVAPGVQRQLPEGFTYDGVTYPEMAFSWSPVALHRNPKYFEDPNTFNPERFMEKQRGADNAWAFTPFGGGKRGCPGMRVATMDLRVLLAQMVLNFEFHCAPGYEGEMKDFQMVNKLRPNLEVVMGPRSRFNHLRAKPAEPRQSIFDGLKAAVSSANAQ